MSENTWTSRISRRLTATAFGLQKRVYARKKPGAFINCKSFRVKINDGLNYYMMYKDIFIKRIYHFDTPKERPLILDCGSNIGMSILYYKSVYPGARVIGFEPDPSILPYLKDNIKNNVIAGVELVEAGLSSTATSFELYSDAGCGSFVGGVGGRAAETGYVKYTIPCVRLRDYIREPVDFLKMNIEGAEWDVLSDSEDKLSLVNEMIIEYHHLPGIPRTLHKILDLLDRNGFEYLINDFDMETNGGVLPPFKLELDSKYFLLIYAKRMTGR